MRQRFPVFISCVLVCLLSGACNEQVADSSAIDSIGGVPTQVGPVWTYAVIDSLADPITLDTVVVTATGEASLSGGTPAVIWSFVGGGRDRTKFVALLPTGIRIQESSRNEFLSEDFFLPMTTGDSWQQLSATEYDSSAVPFLGAISTRATTFQRAAQVNRTWGVASSDTRWGRSEIWIAENVGIVFRHQIEFSPLTDQNNKQLIIKNEVWDLISFQAN